MQSSSFLPAVQPSENDLYHLRDSVLFSWVTTVTMGIILKKNLKTHMFLDVISLSDNRVKAEATSGQSNPIKPSRTHNELHKELLLAHKR